MVTMKNVFQATWNVFRHAGLFRGWHTFQTWFSMGFFTWMCDEDGDLALVVCRCVAFVKYKQSTIFRFGNFNTKPGWTEAPKYLGRPS